MSVIGSSLRSHWLEVAWGVFAAANLAVILKLAQWETIPFHFIWVSLTLVFGLRIWKKRTTWAVLGAVTVVTSAALLWSVARTREGLDELAEPPLMGAMFVAMVWHAHREKVAMGKVRNVAETERRQREREREFVRDASHELRTPITVAKGHAELIRASLAGSQVSEDADVILDELDRLSRISERLLILAASEHSGFLKLSAIHVNELVLGVARRWKPAANRHWEVKVAGEGFIDADPARLEYALDALLENAVKFTREGDRVGIASQAHDGRVVIAVSDDGEGISSQHLDRVFDRFSRADEGRTRNSGGTGLGLAIVKAIAEAHGGSVSVRSTLGQGSTFELRLPRTGGGDVGRKTQDEGSPSLAATPSSD
jgi:signal transduction histidine kinase